MGSGGWCQSLNCSSLLLPPVQVFPLLPSQRAQSFLSCFSLGSLWMGYSPSGITVPALVLCVWQENLPQPGLLCRLQLLPRHTATYCGLGASTTAAWRSSMVWLSMSCRVTTCSRGWRGSVLRCQGLFLLSCGCPQGCFSHFSSHHWAAFGPYSGFPQGATTLAERPWPAVGPLELVVSSIRHPQPLLTQASAAACPTILAHAPSTVGEGD